MHLDYITAEKIRDFAEQQIESNSRVIAITPERALSQEKNPVAKPEDILLIVAIENGEILGYIGILPSLFRQKTNSFFFWNTCWWVNPEAGSRISILLLGEFLTLTRQKVAFSDMTERTGKIIGRLGYEVQKRSGLIFRISTGYHQRSLAVMPGSRFKRLIAFSRNSGLLKMLDSARSTKGLATFHKHIRKSPNMTFSAGDLFPGKNFFDFVSQHSSDDIFVPDKETVEWWMNYPWLVRPDNQRMKIAERYHFSYFSEQHYYLFPVLKENNDIVACGILGVRDGVLKTHFFWADKSFREDFYLHLLDFIFTLPNIHSFQSFHPEFVVFLQKTLYQQKKMARVERYTAKGKLEDTSFRFQDGNGDYIFT